MKAARRPSGPLSAVPWLSAYLTHHVGFDRPQKLPQAPWGCGGDFPPALGLRR